MMLKSIVAVAALSFAMPAAAEAPAAPPPQAKPEEAKRICKLDPRATGTRIPKRVCKTAAEWAKPETGLDMQVKGHGGNPDPKSSVGNFG